MSTVLLVIHILLALGLVGIILLQRNEGGMGGLGGGGSNANMATSRSSANLLTRTTAILAAFFMANSVLLAIVNKNERSTLLDELPELPALEQPGDEQPLDQLPDLPALDGDAGGGEPEAE